MFVLLKHINIQNGEKPKTIMKFFNSLITPILLYNSEIWGAHIKPNQLRSATTFLKSLLMTTWLMKCYKLDVGKLLQAYIKKVSMEVR